MWNQNVINFLVRQKSISFVGYILCILYMCVYIYIYMYIYKSFSTALAEGLRKNIKKRDGEIGKHELNEMGTLNMK